MPPSKKYWKSLQLKDGKIISKYDSSEWKIGEWRTVPAPVESCIGLNASPLIVDAMGYVEMEVLAEVEIDGKTICEDDKVTCERMRILRAWHWKKKDSVTLAVYSAELVIDNFEKIYPEDNRPREAIEAAKAWILNPCEETESAEFAAWSAESAAASAAESAAFAARLKMKKKIQRWIISRLPELETV